MLMALISWLMTGRRGTLWAGFALAAAIVPGAQRAYAQQSTSGAIAPSAEEKKASLGSYLRMPLRFEPNQGQSDKRVQFLSSGAGYSLFLMPADAVLSLRSPAGKTAALEMVMAGGNPLASVAGVEPFASRSNYFIGNDSAKWRTNVPDYARVRYQDLYPGIDLTFYGNQHRLEYDFVVAPGADPKAIRLKFRGMRHLRLDRDGQLVIETAAGEVRLDRPIIYQERRDGTRAAVDGNFAMYRGEVSFRVAKYDRTRPLIIDPVVNYATYLGGSGNENTSGDSKTLSRFAGIVVASDGSAYVTGITNSTNFPLAGAEQASSGGGQDVFVARVNPSGTALVYSTYLGGSNEEDGGGIAVDSNGNAYIAGSTFSGNFPTTAGALQPNASGTGCGFVTKLNNTGSALVYSTYLGGTYTSRLTAIAVDANFNAYVTGTDNLNFPTTASAFQKVVPGQENTVVSKLAVDGKSLVYSTYLGGEKVDVGRGIAVDSLGNAYIVGWTTSSAFPVTSGALQSTHGGASTDAFISKLNPAGSALVYSTYLGGSGDDYGNAIAIDSAGNAYIAGDTTSTNFPTASPLQATNGGSQDAFVAKLNPAGTALVYSTYLGGGGGDSAYAIAIDSLGDAYVTGYTGSINGGKLFPSLYGLAYATNNSYASGFVTEYNPSGSAYVFSTWFGGNVGNTYGIGIGVDPGGNAIITGGTFTTDLPTTTGAFQPAISGNSDAFIAKLWPLQLSPTAIVFPNTTTGTTSAAISFTISNTGFANLNFSSIALTGTNKTNFNISNNTCTSTLPQQSSCTVSVTFSPTSVAAFSAAVTITDNAAALPQVVTLSGNGIAPVTAPQAVFSPATLPFGNQLAGTSSSVQVVTLSNPGTAVLNISSLALTGANPAAFSMNSSCGVTLAINASCNISVTFSPAAGVTGPQSASITATDNAGNSPQSLALTGTGTTPLATLLPATLSFPNTAVGSASASQTLTLSNSGTAPLTISATNTNGGSFNVGNSTCGASLAAGASCTLQAFFQPQTTGPLTGNVQIYDNAVGSPHTSTFSGTGTPAPTPQAVLTPAVVVFANQISGTTSASQTVTLSNPGGATLNITGISLGGTNPSAFGLTNGCGATLAVGTSCSLTVTFTPGGVASFSAAINVVDNATGSPHSAALSGTGIAAPAPLAVLAPAMLTFAGQVTGTTSASQTVTLSNPGNATLNITGITLTGANPGVFALTNSCTATLAAGASCPVTVTFTPTSVASFSAAISVADNASGSPQSATISGTGLAPPDFTTNSPTPPQTISAGAAATYQINVASTSGNFNLPVTLTASGLPTGATAIFTPPIVTPGSAGATSTLVIQTSVTSAQLRDGEQNLPGRPSPSNGRGLLEIASGAAMACLLFFRRMPRLKGGGRVLLVMVGLALVSLGMSGCGGGFPELTGTKTFIISVTGANGSDLHATTVTLTLK